jgi:hypothetical protein
MRRPAQVTIYLNLDSDEVYTEEEVMECYDRDVAQLIAETLWHSCRRMTSGSKSTATSDCSK